MVNRMRHTRGHTRNRRSHHALTGERLSRDVQTGSVHLRHHVDMTTGMYRGRKVFENPLENAPARSDKGTQPAAKQTKKETKEAGKAKAKKK